MILIDGGFTYVPHLIWTADQQYKELRHEVPWVKRTPGRIIREQLRFATQPAVEMTSAQLETLIGQIGSDEVICFSTDYRTGTSTRRTRRCRRTCPTTGAQDLRRQRARDLPAAAGARRVRVCASHDLAPGQMIGATLDDRPIVVVRTRAGELQAYVDRCLHQGARLSGGRLLETVEGDEVGDYRPGEGDVIKCPWHGYEYDAASGCALFDRRRRLRTVRVREEDGWIVAGDRVSAGSGGEDRDVEQPGGLRHGSAAR